MTLNKSDYAMGQFFKVVHSGNFWTNLLSIVSSTESTILCFVYSTSLYNLVNKPNLVHNFFNIMFISFLYMFRVTMCPSSGEIIVSMRHLVLIILCG
jgi:hypothetical protein